MLVLSRKAGECIRIGRHVEVKVLAVHGGKVRLGLSGPPDVTIHREELYQRIHACATSTLWSQPSVAAS